VEKMEEDLLKDQLLETWRIHCRINLYLLGAIAPEAFNMPPPAKGRSFIQMFTHIHNNRLAWLEAAAPELMQGITKIEKTDAVDREILSAALSGSAKNIEALLLKGLASGGKIKNFKPHAPAFLGYLISHEAYHHGEIGIELARIGWPLDKKTSYGIWEWGVR
jgi:uncharacterized damage-inducible protein DinB